jgi:hypothetical protein
MSGVRVVTYRMRTNSERRIYQRCTFDGVHFVLGAASRLESEGNHSARSRSQS